MPIKAKMFLILSPLVLAVLIFSGLRLYSDWLAMEHIRVLQQQTQLVEHLNSLLHELQKERGASIGWLTGDAGFRSTLDQQRAQTDQALAALTRHITEDATDIPEDFQQLSQQLSEQLNSRASWQQRIDSRQTENSAALGYYSQLTGLLLSATPLLSKNNTRPELNGPLMVLYPILEMKERAGLERATIAGAINGGSVTDAVLMRVAALSDSQTQYLAQIHHYASAEINAQLEQWLNQPSMQQVAQVCAQILSRSPQNLNGADWFCLATERIGFLKHCEAALFQNIQKNMELTFQASL